MLLARLLQRDWGKAESDDAKGAPNRWTSDADATQLCVMWAADAIAECGTGVNVHDLHEEERHVQ